MNDIEMPTRTANSYSSSGASLMTRLVIKQEDDPNNGIFLIPSTDDDTTTPYLLCNGTRVNLCSLVSSAGSGRWA